MPKKIKTNPAAIKRSPSATLIKYFMSLLYESSQKNVKYFLHIFCIFLISQKARRSAQDNYPSKDDNFAKENNDSAVNPRNPKNLAQEYSLA